VTYKPHITGFVALISSARETISLAIEALRLEVTSTAHESTFQMHWFQMAQDWSPSPPHISSPSRPFLPSFLGEFIDHGNHHKTVDYRPAIPTLPLTTKTIRFRGLHIYGTGPLGFFCIPPFPVSKVSLHLLLVAAPQILNCPGVV
jgi:hypothetical protein